MFNLIQGSKYVAETISLIISFADLMSSGDTISGTPVISVDVATGTDQNPSNILYSTTSVTHGTIVEQRFRLGIPGVIYHIVYSIQTVAGDTFEKETYLAILPDEDSAVPNWLPLWESSLLYPYEVQETIQSSGTFSSGSLWEQPSDYISSSGIFISGTLLNVVVTYSTYEEDNIKSSALFSSGELNIPGRVTYSPYPEDFIKTNSVFISGSLVVVLVPYSVYPEDFIKSSATFASGTLA